MAKYVVIDFYQLVVKYLRVNGLGSMKEKLTKDYTQYSSERKNIFREKKRKSKRFITRKQTFNGTTPCFINLNKYLYINMQFTPCLKLKNKI